MSKGKEQVYDDIPEEEVNSLLSSGSDSDNEEIYRSDQQNFENIRDIASSSSQRNTANMSIREIVEASGRKYEEKSEDEEDNDNDKEAGSDQAVTQAVQKFKSNQEKAKATLTDNSESEGSTTSTAQSSLNQLNDAELSIRKILQTRRREYKSKEVEAGVKMPERRKRQRLRKAIENLEWLRRAQNVAFPDWQLKRKIYQERADNIRKIQIQNRREKNSGSKSDQYSVDDNLNEGFKMLGLSESPNIKGKSDFARNIFESNNNSKLRLRPNIRMTNGSRSIFESRSSMDSSIKSKPGFTSTSSALLRTSMEGRIETESSPLIILYRSLEYPNNFVRKLADQMNKSNLNAEAGERNSNSMNYHKQIKQLLECDIEVVKEEDKPDIIVLGEFTPIENIDVAPSGYTVRGNVNLAEENGSEARGTRGMTVITRDNSAKWHRVTVHNKSTESPDYWNPRADTWVEKANKKLKELGIDESKFIEQNTKNRRILTQLYYKAKKIPGISSNDIKEKMTAYQTSYDQSRKKQIENMRSAIPNLGQFAEIVYKNHYISLVHVKGIGASAKSNLLQAAKKIPHMSFGGDTNLSIAAKKFDEHNYEEGIGSDFTVKMNTESFAVPNLGDPAFDPHGKTASGSVAHDGIVIRSTLTAAYKILGSRWAVHTNDFKQQIVSSDHKGILISINPSKASVQSMSTPIKPK